MAPVRILQAVGGTDFSWAPGEIVSMTDEQVAVWCDGERAELASDLVVDQAAIGDAAELAVRQALEEAERQRQAELEGLQVQARAVVDDNVVDPDDELAGQLRELAAELVAGVAPLRAAELAIVASIGTRTTLDVNESADDTAAATTTEEDASVSASEQPGDGADTAAAPAEAREAKQKPERAARRSRGGGREPGPETRG